jgi:hypothetical protein
MDKENRLSVARQQPEWLVRRVRIAYQVKSELASPAPTIPEKLLDLSSRFMQDKIEGRNAMIDQNFDKVLQNGPVHARHQGRWQIRCKLL